MTGRQELVTGHRQYQVPTLHNLSHAVMFDVIERGGAVQGIATIPEFFWELSFGIYLIVKGFKPSPMLARLHGEPVPPRQP